VLADIYVEYLYIDYSCTAGMYCSNLKYLDYDRDKWKDPVHTVLNFHFPQNSRKVLTS
jgi:hypothetical protein